MQTAILRFWSQAEKANLSKLRGIFEVDRGRKINRPNRVGRPFPGTRFRLAACRTCPIALEATVAEKAVLEENLGFPLNRSPA